MNDHKVTQSESLTTSLTYSLLNGKRCYIRWMIRRDMPEVLEIEKQSYSYPWTEEEFHSCLRERNCIGMVAEVDDKITGFMVYALKKHKLEVLNFAVSKQYRRQGVGSAMNAKLVHKLSPHRRTKIIAECHDGNLVGHLFLRKNGFRCQEVLRNAHKGEHFYSDNYLFVYDYNDPFKYAG